MHFCFLLDSSLYFNNSNLLTFDCTEALFFLHIKPLNVHQMFGFTV